MKKHLLALAALATVSGVAVAQSNVTVYGILDTSYTSVNHTTAANGRTTGINTANWMPSVLGFTGTEDLGGGLKANFQLEADINTDTGANASSSTLFRRISTVGLSSNNYGTVKLGKHIDMLFLQSFINNVRPAHSGSLAVVGGVNYGLTGANSNSDAEIFMSNGVQYQSPAFSGLSFKYQHTFGEVAGNTSKASGSAYGVNYDGIQNLNLSAVYKESKSNDGVKSQRYTLVGAKYTLGQFTLAGQVGTYKDPTTSTNLDVTAYETGVAYAVTPALTAAVNYISFDDKNNTAGKPTHTSASLKYALSKRTSLWTMYAVADNKGTSGIEAFYNGGNTTSAVVAGQKQTGIAAGVTHSF
jgi:predicted porin